MTTLKKIRDLIEEHSDIIEEKQGGITMYSFIDKETGETNGSIQLAVCKESTIAQYKTDNHWFTPSKTCQRAAISVTFLRSEKKGMGKLFLGYGVLAMSEKNKRIKYSVLDDASDSSTKIKANIYSHFGYTPTTAAEKIKNQNNEIKLGGEEKQVLLTTFTKKAREYLLGEKSPQSRSRSRSRSQNRNQTGQTRRTRRTRITRKNSRAAENVG